MKKLYATVCLTALVSIATSTTYAADTYPFIGKRSFNFMGGSGTEKSMTIKKNGDTTIRACGDLAAGGSCEIEYKGKFKNPIITKDGLGYLIKGGKIYSLDHSKIAKGCSGDDTSDCVSDLY